MMKHKKKRKLDVHMRWMIRREMNQVLSIESQCFDWPWTEQEFVRCLRQRNCIGMVAEDLDCSEIYGFMVYELYITEILVIDFAVSPAWQRQGVGTAMVDKLKGKLSPARRHKLRLSVSDRNLSGHLFFRANGFQCVGIDRGVCCDGSDKYVFQLSVKDRD